MSFQLIPDRPAVPGSARDGGDWRNRAACLDEDPELFFAVGSTAPGALLQIEDAKAVCARCEVMDNCLRWALENGADDGVWGGLSEDERRALKRRNARAARAAQTPPKPPTPTKTDPVTRTICGTGAGYRRHTDLGERQCEPCADWRRARTQNRAECGTLAGYRAHSDRRDAACGPCKAAKAAESRSTRQRKRWSPSSVLGRV